MTYISIAGNIGVGKTTLARIISQNLQFKLAEERIDLDILERFYSDIRNNVKPSEHAFQLQKYFLFTRGATQLNIQASRANWVQERNVFEDRYIFATHLNRQGFISDEKFEEYLANFEICSSGLNNPDLLIHLKAPIPILMERIWERGRPMEIQLADFDNPYLGQLEELYKDMMQKYNGPKLVLDSRSYSPQDAKTAIDLIKSHVKI